MKHVRCIFGSVVIMMVSTEAAFYNDHHVFPISEGLSSTPNFGYPATQLLIWLHSESLRVVGYETVGVHEKGYANNQDRPLGHQGP